MMQRIIGRIGTGAFTLSTLAAELGISRESLSNRLSLMERLGQITREPCDTPPDACSHCCAGCACSGEADSSMRYVLTEKGKRLCGQIR
jgi:DNA-binding Lrp family transcriptional regulator